MLSQLAALGVTACAPYLSIAPASTPQARTPFREFPLLPGIPLDMVAKPLHDVFGLVAHELLQFALNLLCTLSRDGHAHDEFCKHLTRFSLLLLRQDFEARKFLIHLLLKLSLLSFRN